MNVYPLGITVLDTTIPRKVRIRKVWTRTSVTATWRFKSCDQCLPHPATGECMTDPEAWRIHVETRLRHTEPTRAVLNRTTRTQVI